MIVGAVPRKAIGPQAQGMEADRVPPRSSRRRPAGEAAGPEIGASQPVRQLSALRLLADILPLRWSETRSKLSF